jgi:NitT/TauT family transport system permease protein
MASPTVADAESMLPSFELPAVDRDGPIRRFVTNDYFVRFASVVLGLTLWELIGSHYPYSMSSPWNVVRAMRQYLVPQILPAAWQTLQTFSLGFAICIVAGIPIGLAMARIKLIRVALEPYVTTLNSMPMLAIFPLMIIAFGINTQLRVSATVLFGIFGIIVNTFTGASRIDVTLEDVGRSFVASGWKRLTTIIFPGCLAYIFAGIRVGFGHAMIGAVVIELEASLVGVGSLMNHYTTNLQLGPFFVIVLLLGSFSILFSVCLRRLERWATMPWTRSQRSFDRRARHFAQAHVQSVAAHDSVTRAGHSRGSLRQVFAPVASILGPVYRFLASVSHLLTGRWTSWILRVGVFAGLIAIWQHASLTTSRAVMPSPHGVVSAINRQVFQHHTIFGPLGNSLEVFALGFGLSVVLGIPLGLMMGRYRVVALALDPYVSFLYGLPIIVFVPIFVIWLGFGFNFGVAFVIVSAIWVVVINTMQGVRQVDQNLIDTGRSFCSSERKIMRTIVVPSTIPFVIAGARLAFSVSWIGVIVSEVVSSETGIGGLISTYATSFQMADMVVPILFIALISVALLAISNRYAPRLTPWANVNR